MFLAYKELVGKVAVRGDLCVLLIGRMRGIASTIYRWSERASVLTEWDREVWLTGRVGTMHSVSID